jgi:hypothetical protein
VAAPTYQDVLALGDAELADPLPDPPDREGEESSGEGDEDARLGALKEPEPTGRVVHDIRVGDDAVS